MIPSDIFMRGPMPQAAPPQAPSDVVPGPYPPGYTPPVPPTIQSLRAAVARINQQRSPQGLPGFLNGLFNTDHMRNQQMQIADNLRQQGIHPLDAANLSGVLAYNPYNAQTQANYLAMLKHLGYLSYQAR